MARIVSRVVVRLAIVAASLAWAGFVFTNTVGDPTRGERIAASVLADDDARAEIVDPITSAVVATTGLPPEQRSFVSGRVDELLRGPSGARAFIDPFAGSYARMLGEDDPRPAEFDLAPLVDEVVVGVPGLDPTTLPTQRFEIPTVPLPRAELGWMSGVRSGVSAATTGLAIAALIGFAVGFAIGNRRWVLRRFGLWAAFAGAGWVVVPFLVSWAARQWASGADSVIAVAVEEALSGLRVTAILLCAVGVAAFSVSFAPLGVPVPAGRGAEPAPVRRGRRAGSAAATPRPSSATANQQTTVHSAASPVGPDGPQARSMPTAEIPETRRSGPAPSADELDTAVFGDDEQRDPLWEYYSP
jgi:hypothetical protein